jgi:hypothetical protein
MHRKVILQGNGLKRYVETPDGIRVKDFGIRGVEYAAVLVMVLAKSFRIRYAFTLQYSWILQHVVW